ISTYIHLQQQNVLSKDELRQYTEGLICILSVHSSKLKQAFHDTSYENIYEDVKKWEEMFAPGDFYFGIADHGIQSERRLHETVKAFCELYMTIVVALYEDRNLIMDVDE